MTARDSDFPRTLRKKGQEVTIYCGFDQTRNQTYYTVVYHLGGHRQRNTRRSLQEAEKLAEDVLEKMANNRVPVSLSHEDWELLKKLKRICKDRAPWRFLEDASAAQKIVQDHVTLTEAAEFWKQRHHHRSKVKVSALYEEYIRELEQTASERHLRDARNRLGRFEEAFNGHVLADIPVQALEEFLNSLQVGDRTRNNHRDLMVTFFRWARTQGHLEEGKETAAEKVKRRQLDEHVVEIFSVEEMRSLFDGLRKDLEAYTAIGSFAGLRPSEIVRLEWDAIDFDQRHIFVSPQVARKVRSSRYVPLSDNLVAWLEPHRRASGPVTYAKSAELLSRDARARGVTDEWPEDVMRHSFCSYRLAQTKSISVVAEEAGNSDAIIRKHYRKPIPESQAALYFKIQPGVLS